MTKFIKTLFAAALLVPSAALFAAKFSLPEYEKYQLDNGLTVYLMEQTEVPLISLNLVTNSGSLSDGELAGLNYVTSNAVLFGDKTTSKTDFEAAFEFVGSSARASSSFDSSGFAFSSHKDDFKPLFKKLADAVITPSFAQADLDKFIQLHLQNLQQRQESPRNVINNYYMQSLYGDKGYGQASLGTPETLAKISRQDVVKQHANYFVPNNMALVVAGDFKAASLKKLIGKTLNSWKAGELPQAEQFSAKDLTENNVLLVNKDDARETTFMLGGFGIQQSNPDRISLDVINTILGGRFTSWLNDELRVNTGLTYGARSRFAAQKSGGTFAISTFTKNSSTEAAIDLALATYHKLFEGKLDQATLDSAKNYLIGLFPPRYETSSQLAALMAQMFVYDFDESYINNFQQQVNSLDLAKANQLIKQYFPKDALQFVLIGKAEEIKEVAKKYGKLSQVELQSEN